MTLVCFTSLASQKTTQYGNTIGGGTSYGVSIKDLKTITVYSGGYVNGFRFTFLNGTVLNYGNAVNTATTINLINKTITALVVRSGFLIDAFKFQIYDIQTNTYSWTAQMGGNGGSSYTLDETTIAPNSIDFEITRFEGQVDNSNVRNFVLRSSYTQCL